MLVNIISIPIFIVIVMLQTSIISNTPMLQGSADLILLVIIAWTIQEEVRAYWLWTIVACLLLGFVSESPLYLTLFAYLSLTAIVRYTRRRLWKAPLLSMWSMTLIGTPIVLGITLVGRWLEGAEISLIPALNMIVLPSLLANLLLAAPIYGVVHDLAKWLYPKEIEV